MLMWAEFTAYLTKLEANITIFAIVGFMGQAMFFSRFLVQWIHSEKMGRSSIPVVFWYLSLGGSALVLVYAINRADAVFIIGQLPGFFVYLRNLQLIYRERRLQAADTSKDPAAGGA